MNSGQRVGILGVGSYVPETVRTNDWWPASFTANFEEHRQKDVTRPEAMLAAARTPAQRIQFEHMMETWNDPFRGTVERRVLETQHAPSFMEINAAKKALNHAGIDPADLDAVIVFSMPPDNATPCNAGIVQTAIGARHSNAMGVDTACASFVSGMMVGEALIKTGQAKYVLVVTSATQARIGDPDDATTVNFGDGAGAAVLGPVPSAYGFEGFAIRTLGEYHQGICVGPRSPQPPWYQAGGPMYILSRNIDLGRAVVGTSCDIAVHEVEAVLRKTGTDKKDITHWYSHQPMSWFSAACRKASGLSHAQTVDTFKQIAGVGAGNIGYNLDTAVQQGQLEPGDKLMLYAFGGGVVSAAAVVTWSRSA